MTKPLTLRKGASTGEYKGYNIQNHDVYPTKVIKAFGQGMVPLRLSGQFSNWGEATKNIDGYLRSLKKGKKYGTSKDSGTSK